MAFSSSMAFSSPDMSASSNNQVIPNQISQIVKPNNLSEIISLPNNNNNNNNNKRENIIIDNKEVYNPMEHFISRYPSGHPCGFIHVEYEQKLKAIKHMLMKAAAGEGDDVPFEGLAMIDAIQRLGIDYNFKDEIVQILKRQYVLFATHGDQHHNDDLQEVALRFRLLRQEGYHVSADVFNYFRDEDGKFEQTLSEDINGLISLYEASQLSIRGDDVLDEAGVFSAKHLNECLKQLDHHQAGVVKHIMVHPYRKSMHQAKSFSLGNIQSHDYEWILDLQELAEMDLKLVQTLHRKEIVQISKWWKDLGLAKKLEFARDQPLKWYIWSMTCFTDPSLSWQRIELTKPISFIYIIDDIFDVHGTIDELTLFTETIDRWDLAAIGQLPEYMKICFQALNDITNEISNKVYKEYGHNPVHSLQKAWASLCKAFLVEAKWFVSGQLPKAEEYLENGIVSSGAHVGLVHIFYLLGHDITSETVEQIDSNPAIISSVATIIRLWDDLGSAKDENQDGKDGSYIDYYMMEHQGTTVEEAQKQAINKISDAWKRLNQECLSANPFSASFKRASLNIARMVPLMYSYDDNQRLPSLEAYIKSLLFDNLPTRGMY